MKATEKKCLMQKVKLPEFLNSKILYAKRSAKAQNRILPTFYRKIANKHRVAKL